MSLLHAPRFSSWARGHLVCRVEGVADRFALSFDDGPNPAATGRVLDVLSRRGAHATFFMLGGRVRRHAALVRRVVAEGHEPAVHGHTHLPLPVLPRWAIRMEVRRCAAAIVAVAGVRARLYRPPFGFMTPGQARLVRHLGYQPVLGDVYPEDPQCPGVDRILERVLARLRGGSILILHDGSALGDADRTQTVEALDLILVHAARVGLRAIPVHELLAADPGGESREKH